MVGMVSKGNEEKVKAKWVVRVPEGGEVVVRVGERAEVGKVLVKMGGAREESFDFSMVLKSFRPDLKGRVFKEGELMVQLPGMFGKKVYSPVEGEVVGVDEFGNIKFRLAAKREEGEILAPVVGKVVEVDEGKIGLEFRATKVEGKGLSEGKAWGELYPKIIENLGQINMGLKDKVIVTG